MPASVYVCVCVCVCVWCSDDDTKVHGGQLQQKSAQCHVVCDVTTTPASHYHCLLQKTWSDSMHTLTTYDWWNVELLMQHHVGKIAYNVTKLYHRELDRINGEWVCLVQVRRVGRASSRSHQLSAGPSCMISSRQSRMKSNSLLLTSTTPWLTVAPPHRRPSSASTSTSRGVWCFACHYHDKTNRIDASLIIC